MIMLLSLYDERCWCCRRCWVFMYWVYHFSAGDLGCICVDRIAMSYHIQYGPLMIYAARRGAGSSIGLSISFAVFPSKEAWHGNILGRIQIQ